MKYEEYGIIGKWFTWGIPLHEGHLFGVANKVINLLVCIALLTAVGLGLTSWIKKMRDSNVKVPQELKTNVNPVGYRTYCTWYLDAVIWFLIDCCIYYRGLIIL